MGNAQLEAIFLDTSIHIARVVHGPKTKRRIKDRLALHKATAAGLVSRQEFKRRLLQEADYLLVQLRRYGSFDELLQHLIRLPSSWPKMVRKQHICLQTLAQIHGGSDREKTDRLRLYLRTLLVTGLKRFDQSVDALHRETGCGCARVEVVEKKPFERYELGPMRYSKLKPGACGVAAFLTNNKDVRERILRTLQGIPAERQSAELQRVQQFLEKIEKKADKAGEDDPCLSVGDLMISLESAGVPCFYTLNSKESQYLCRALDQTLVVRPLDPLKDDVVCDSAESQWPLFGRLASGSKETDANSGQT